MSVNPPYQFMCYQHIPESDFRQIHQFLSEVAYWSLGINEALLRRAFDHSLCFAIKQDQHVLAFARVVTDQATFANLLDVFVIPSHRGQGLSKQLLTALFADPRLQGLRRFTLATRDAHGLYQQFGFHDLRYPHSYQERYVERAYMQNSASSAATA